MSHGFWLAPLGWGVFSLGVVAAIILFAVKKRFYPVMYLVSIATYIFTIGFVIDRFDLGKNSILLALAFSSLAFILAGVYFTKKFSQKKTTLMRDIPDKQGRARLGR